MLDNSIDKMLLISPSSTNQWPQNQTEEKSSNLMASTMEKSPPPPQSHRQQLPAPPQQALKCPRCDSSNTKFCYYNNYSLSQPRHFCKACKRYWTRGGTLRNVPVGGGCRKNKRVKRASSNSAEVSSDSSLLNPNPNSRPQIDISISASNHQMNQLFYGFDANPSESSFPTLNSRIDALSGFNLSSLALGFASGKQIQDPNYSNLYSSLLFQLQKFKDSNFQQNISAFSPFEMNGSTESAVKVESQDQQSRFHWNNENSQNQSDQFGYSSFDSSLYWNLNSSTTTAGAIWHDPANIGSSVTSLI